MGRLTMRLESECFRRRTRIPFERRFIKKPFPTSLSIQERFVVLDKFGDLVARRIDVSSNLMSTSVRTLEYDLRKKCSYSEPEHKQCFLKAWTTFFGIGLSSIPSSSV